jgi:hypothetical protein
MSAPKAAAAKQSPMIDDMLSMSLTTYLTAFGMLVMAAVGLWMIEHDGWD